MLMHYLVAFYIEKYELFFLPQFFHFFVTAFHFLATPLSFVPLFSPVPISTLKQHSTTLMLSDGLCGFKVKNANRKKISGEKEGGVVKKWSTVKKK
jgi:hypothetical protein